MCKGPGQTRSLQVVHKIRCNLSVFLLFSIIQFGAVHAIPFSFYFKKTSVRHCCPWVTVIICVCNAAASLNTNLFSSRATITCFVTVFSLQTGGEYVLCCSVFGVKCRIIYCISIRWEQATYGAAELTPELGCVCGSQPLKGHLSSLGGREFVQINAD